MSSVQTLLDDIWRFFLDRLPVHPETSLPEIEVRLYRYSKLDFRVHLIPVIHAQDRLTSVLHYRFVVLVRTRRFLQQPIHLRGVMHMDSPTEISIPEEYIPRILSESDLPVPGAKSVKESTWAGLIATKPFSIVFRGRGLWSDPPSPLLSRFRFFVVTCRRSLVSIVLWLEGIILVTLLVKRVF